MLRIERKHGSTFPVTLPTVPGSAPFPSNCPRALSCVTPLSLTSQGSHLKTPLLSEREGFLGVESLSFSQLTIKRTEWGQQSIEVPVAQGEAFKYLHALLPTALGNVLFLVIRSVCVHRPLWGHAVLVLGPNSAPTEVSGRISVDFK